MQISTQHVTSYVKVSRTSPRNDCISGHGLPQRKSKKYKTIFKNKQ
ncbi:hypothetical protein PXD04_03800 [Methanosphaera sp. ISO3-F5]|nr:hypothetical protein [Methanosphaera sp. ISO3-F5]WQH64918.1 hypothetical protein PXD04_03800 [Methanosphaera sp. ISO3-F5]